MEIVKKFFSREDISTKDLQILRKSVFNGLNDLEKLLSDGPKLDRRLKRRREGMNGRRKSDIEPA